MDMTTIGTATTPRLAAALALPALLMLCCAARGSGPEPPPAHGEEQVEEKAQEEKDPRREALEKARSSLLQYQTAEARATLEPFAARAGEDAEVAMTLGQTLEQEKKYGEAAQHLRKAAQLAPQDPAPQVHLGEVLLRERKTTEAEATFRKARDLAQARLEADGDDALAHYYLGIANQRLRQHDQSIAALERARQLDPDNPLVHYQIGVTRAFQERWSDAAEAMTRALERESGLAYAYYFRGLANDRLGRKDLLVGDMERFLALAPEAPEADRARAIVRAARR